MVLPCGAPTLEPPGGSRWVYVYKCLCLMGEEAEPSRQRSFAHTPVWRGDVRCLYHLWALGTWDELTSHRLHSAANEAPPIPTQLWLVIASKDWGWLKCGPCGLEGRGAELWASDRFHDYMYDHALHVPDGSSASQASAPTLISESLVPLPSQS